MLLSLIIIWVVFCILVPMWLSRYRIKGKHFALLIAAVILLPAAARAECLPSAHSVWAKHEGAWATWRNIEGHKCWFVGERHGSVLSLHTHHDFRRATVGTHWANGNLRSNKKGISREIIPLPHPRTLTKHDIADLWMQFILFGPGEAWQ